MTQRSPEELLCAARGAHLVPAEQKALGRTRLISAMSAGVVTVTAATAEAGIASSLVGGGAIATATGSLFGSAISAVAVGVVAGALVMSPGTEPVTRRGTAVSAQASQTPLGPPTSIPSAARQDIAELPTPAEVLAPARVASARARQPEPPALEEETRLLQAAQRALRNSQYSEALQVLGERDRRFQNGLLAEEATALRVLVHCGASYFADARRWAELFLEHYGDSPLLPRMISACPQVFERVESKVLPSNDVRDKNRESIGE